MVRRGLNGIRLMLKIALDFSILYYHNFQGVRYLGSSRIFSIHRILHISYISLFARVNHCQYQLC